MSQPVQDPNINFCPYGLSMNDVSDFAKEKPDTLVKILRDTVKWGAEANIGSKRTTNLTAFGNGLEACADFLSIKDIPGTAIDLKDHAWGVIYDGENRWNHISGTLENGCDLVVETCDVVTSAEFFGAFTLSGVASAAISKVSSSLTMKSFSIKIFHSLQEIYDGHTRDISEMSESEISDADTEYYKAWCDLVWKTAIFSLALLTFLPFVIEGFAATSTVFLTISTVGLIFETAAFFIDRGRDPAPIAESIITV